MWLLKNIEAVEEGGEPSSTEYAVKADHHFVGDWKWRCYHLRLWELDVTKKKGEDRFLNLRYEYDPDLFREQWKSASRDAYYHGGGLADEIVSLASLFLRTHLSLGPRVRSDGNPEWIKHGCSGHIDPGLVRDSTDLGELENWFPLVENLPDELWQPFILSVRLYHQSIGMIEQNPDLAYLSLVSSVEVLAEEHPIGNVSLSDIDKGLAQAVARVEPEDLRTEIQDRILNREHFTRRRFRRFVLDHVDELFWERETRPDIGRIEKDELPELLNRIYDQRSRTLHSGEPFPPNIERPPMQGAEISPSRGMSKGGRRWEPDEFVPHPHFFERLVNHCLKEHLKRHQPD